MSYQREREDFLLAMQGEGVPAHVARVVLRHAATVQRCAELACSSEAADRDRVMCPTRPTVSGGACLCDDYGTRGWVDGNTRNPDPEAHGMVPRYVIRDERASRAIRDVLAPFDVVPVFGGDPRGACVKLKVPSGRTDDWGREGLCVPVRG